MRDNQWDPGDPPEVYRDYWYSAKHDPPRISPWWGVAFGVLFGAALWALLALGMWRMGWY